GIILHATPGYASYQWYQAGQAIPGGTDSTFQPGSNGGYNVVVVDANGCEGTSPVMNLTDVGKASVADLKAGRAVQIYPNPTTGIIYINAPVAVDAEIYGSDGRVLNRFVASSQLDLSHYPTG